MSHDTVFPLRSALRFPIPGPEHAELGPGDVRPSLQFELSDKRYQISDIRYVTYNGTGSVGSPHGVGQYQILIAGIMGGGHTYLNLPKFTRLVRKYSVLTTTYRKGLRSTKT